jgi:3-methyl-2-oxobutanoate hydroxymethyltransferase
MEKQILNPALMRKRKEKKTSLSVVTAYDYPFAKMAESAGIDMLLVGDSYANVVLGYKSTRDIGMVEMLSACGAVCRGATQTHVIADMPWLSDKTPAIAIKNALKFIEVGASSVKVEGEKFEVITALIEQGVDVVGHLGLTPQTAKSFKQVGKLPEEAAAIIKNAQKLESIGICALVLEHVPEELGESVSKALKIPVIGIGASENTDAQVMVLHDVLGLFAGDVPAVARKIVNGYEYLTQGLEEFNKRVREKTLHSS